MEFHELVELVKESIPECEHFIQNNAHLVLSEADFERILSNFISDKLSSSNLDEAVYVVHNQISHYPGYDTQHFCKRDSQVDILIMKDVDIKEDNALSKGFVYLGDAIPIELKYYKKWQSVNSIKGDLEKSEFLLSDNFYKCAFFVIALLEEDNINQKEAILRTFDSYKDKDNMYTFLLTKTCNH